MTVADLIQILQKQPQHLPVVYSRYSEYCLLEEEDIGVEALQPARPDGWVHLSRDDKPKIEYLVFPGN